MSAQVPDVYEMQEPPGFHWRRVLDGQQVIFSVGGVQDCNKALFHVYGDDFNVRKAVTPKQMRQLARALLEIADIWEAAE